MRRVLIGVQCRSDSERLPRKAMAIVENKPILDWVLDACIGVVRYMKKDREMLQADINYCLLVPAGDPLAELYKQKCTVYEGSKDDVISRYVNAAKINESDFIVRITGDCQAIPTHTIAKHIKSALIKNRDYTTNTMIRTFREGMDVQVFSRRLLSWIDENAKEKEDREHVGTILSKERFPFHDKEGRPSVCHVLSEYYEPDVKTSIDTPEDLEKARQREALLKKAMIKAKRTGVLVT